MVIQKPPFFAAILLLLSPGLRAAGELDTTFNPDADGEVKAVALAPDGKIMIGGSFSVVGGKDARGVARLLPDGSRDLSWSNKVAGTVPSCVVLADGSTIISDMEGYPPSVYRFRPDGSSDSLFRPVRVSEGTVHGMALNHEGNLLLAGTFTALNNTSRRGFGCVGMDGILKNLPTAQPESGKTVYSILPRSDRSILLGGDFSLVDGKSRTLLAKIGWSGYLDSQFAPQLPVAQGNAVLCVAPADKGGAFLAGGSFHRMMEGKLVTDCLARFQSDGTRDPWFKPFFTHATGVPRVNSIAVQADGKIIVAGDFTTVNDVACKGLARLQSNGLLDRSFKASAVGVTGLTLQQDGKLIISGTFSEVNGVPRNRIARLNNDLVKDGLSVRQNHVAWYPAGASPHADFVTFELSTDSGATWQSLGAAKGSSSSWYVQGLDLPLSGMLRMRARTSSGNQNGSSGVIEQVKSYTLVSNVYFREKKDQEWIYLTDGQTTPIDYGELPQGSPLVRTFEIYAGGSANLIVEGIDLPAGFSWVNPPALPASISLFNHLTVSLQADATAPGAIGGTAILRTNDPDEGAFEFPLAGMVVGPDIAVVAGEELQSGQTTPVEIGRTIQGEEPASRAFVIHNRGSRDLVVSGVSVSGGFSVESPQASSLPPGESQVVTVKIDPRVAGRITGELEILSSDADEPVFRVPLLSEVINPLERRVLKTRTKLNRKTGLREQTVRISNWTTTATAPGFRVIVRGLPDWLQVRNASEVLPDGSVVIEVFQPIAPGGSFDLVLEYEMPKKKPVVISPQIAVEVILDVPPAVAGAAGRLAVEKCERTCDGHFAVTFLAVPGRRYQVEYSADGRIWKASAPTRAAGSKVRWLDCGCPHTECAPADVGRRFYRVRELE